MRYAFTKLEALLITLISCQDDKLELVMHKELSLLLEQILILLHLNNLHVVFVLAPELKVEDLFTGPVVGWEVYVFFEVAGHLIQMNNKSIASAHTVY